MNRLATICLALLALLAAAALASAQGKSDDVSLETATNPVVFRTPTALTGRVKGAKTAVPVTLQRRSPTGTEFANVATANTTGNGDYTFTIRPKRNGVFRTVSGTVMSDELLLGVSPKIGLTVSSTQVAPNSRVRFRGKVRPRHNGSKAQIQLKDAAGTWTVVKETRLRRVEGKRYSRYRTRVTVPATGTYRVVLPAHADHAEGASPEVVINVG